MLGDIYLQSWISKNRHVSKNRDVSKNRNEKLHTCQKIYCFGVKKQ